METWQPPSANVAEKLVLHQREVKYAKPNDATNDSA
jgi:hypothetical protein